MTLKKYRNVMWVSLFLTEYVVSCIVSNVILR